ncbi:MAG TPA: hypothetical protein VGK74_23645 [Symbiobacteriaceae bacterium]|jgi:hypothetical protein
MRQDAEQSLVVEFEELFALRDRLRPVADEARRRFAAAGLPDGLEAEVFDQELEFRGAGDSSLLIRLDSYHLEITGAPPDLPTHVLAAIVLEEAGAYRLLSVEVAWSLTAAVPAGRSLDLVHKAFSPADFGGSEPMLDRRFTMTWGWGTPTAGYVFEAAAAEDREIAIGFKAREGYLTLPELQQGGWFAAHARRFDGLLGRFFTQLGWSA